MLKSGTTYRSLMPGCTCNVHVIKVFYVDSTYVKARIALVTKATGSLVDQVRTYKIPLESIKNWREK
jgi:hypothetical protein